MKFLSSYTTIRSIFLFATSLLSLKKKHFRREESALKSVSDLIAAAMHFFFLNTWHLQSNCICTYANRSVLTNRVNTNCTEFLFLRSPPPPALIQCSATFLSWLKIRKAIWNTAFRWRHHVVSTSNVFKESQMGGPERQFSRPRAIDLSYYIKKKGIYVSLHFSQKWVKVWSTDSNLCKGE